VTDDRSELALPGLHLRTEGLLQLASLDLDLLEGQHAEAHAGVERVAGHPRGLVAHARIVAEAPSGGKARLRRRSLPGSTGVIPAPGRTDYRDPVVSSPDQPTTVPAREETEAEPEAVVPAVVVVMVAHDPGPWFEDALASGAAQDDPNAALLVIDCASVVDLEVRIASAAPDAHLKRLDENVGFGPAANEVLGAVEGAAFYLFCHDDVRLDPDVIQVMV